MPNRTQQVRVMDPDVYDYLELIAEAFGGIGGGDWWDDREFFDDDPAPYCAWGAAMFSGDPSVDRELRRLGIETWDNDNAVRRVLGVNDTLGRLVAAGRIPFADWCAALNVVRGER